MCRGNSHKLPTDSIITFTTVEASAAREPEPAETSSCRASACAGEQKRLATVSAAAAAGVSGNTVQLFILSTSLMMKAASTFLESNRSSDIIASLQARRHHLRRAKDKRLRLAWISRLVSERDDRVT